MDEFARFVGLFGTLRDRCNGAPGRLQLLAQNDPARSIAKLALEVCQAAEQAKRKLATNDRRYLLGAPREFLPCFEDWNQRWSRIAAEASMQERIQEAARIVDRVKELFESFPEHAEGMIDEVVKQRNPYHPFDPTEDDPLDCVFHALDTAADVADAWGDDPAFEINKKASGALSYIKETLGLDLADAFKRWKQIR